MTKKEENISKQLQELEKIVQWFQDREDLDVQAGLEKVKEGAVLAKELKARLKKIENEFTELKKGLETDSEDER